MQPLIMVIDDSQVIRTILNVCLRRAGYEVRCFEDGVQALGWLNTAQARIPDLIFVDLGLPKLDGYEIIRLLKAKPALESTALVILSQRDGILDRLKGRLAGAHAYLTKPCKIQTILETVQMYLERVYGREITQPMPPSRLAAAGWSQETVQRVQRGTRP